MVNVSDGIRVFKRKNDPAIGRHVEEPQEALPSETSHSQKEGCTGLREDRKLNTIQFIDRKGTEAREGPGGAGTEGSRFHWAVDHIDDSVLVTILLRSF